MAEASQTWLLQHKKLEALENQAEEHNALFELQQYQLKELNELNLTADEYPSLEDEHQQLSHAESILSSLQSAIDICKDNDEQNIQTALAQVQTLLENMPYRSPGMNSAYELLNTALIQVEEASNELLQAAESLDMNPTRLQELDDRLTAIHQLARKHKVKPEELPAFHHQLQNEVGGSSSADEQIAELKQELKELEAAYQTLADELSNKRNSGAVKLSKAINTQLKKLDMDSASFTVALNSDVNQMPRTKGNENIEFLISTNPGQGPKPLIKIASGGELSRISLAIQVVTAQTSSIPSLIFDEVDVGIGGSVALTVGDLLRQLGEKGQVLCVTHQAQVASQGNHHLYVSKLAGKNSISTQVSELNGEEKVIEIARMLGGNAENASSMAHAREMMAS